MNTPFKHVLYGIAGIITFVCFYYACELFPKFAFWSALVLFGLLIITIVWKSLDLDNVDGDFEPENDEE